MDLSLWKVFRNLDCEFLSNVSLALTVGSGDRTFERWAGIMVMQNGDVFSVGKNLNGCLGVAGIPDAKEPVKIGVLSGKGVHDLAAGVCHVVALTSAGQVYTWGDNKFCQLGDGMRCRISNVPLLVAGNLEGKFVNSVVCGMNHTLVLTDEGEVYGWGYNKHGRTFGKARKGLLSMFYLKFIDDEVIFGPTKIHFPCDGNVKIVSLGAGRCFSVALTDEGQIFCWGSNEFGQLGTISTPSTENTVPQVLETPILFKKVVCGAYHALAISQGDLCYMWGRHGDRFTTSPVQVPEVTKVTEVAASYLVHMCVLKAENGVYAFGPFVDLPLVSMPRGLPLRRDFKPRKPELTDFLCTDVPFAAMSKLQVMWRAMRFHEQLNLSLATLPATISTSHLSYREEEGCVSTLEALIETLTVCIDWIPSDRITLKVADARGFELIFWLDSIGTGNGGSVFKAKMSGHAVAVKIQQNCTTNKVTILHRELQALAAIGSHVNVLRFIGASKLQHNVHPDLVDVLIITELCELGDLRSFLVGRRGYFHDEVQGDRIVTRALLACTNSPYVQIDFSVTTTNLQVVEWSIQFASGMNYLASKKIIHGDLALRNLLLTGTKVLKISDFGLSRTIPDKNYYKISGGVFPWASAAPETLDENKLSNATDVWGFGVTIWEMFTLGETPYDSQFESLTADFKAALKAGQRLDKPMFATTTLYDIMKSCWHLDPKLRPTFNDLKERFEEELRNAQLR